MTYNDRERSAEAGRPIEIYRFNRDYQAWRYTSADREITVDSQIYQPRAISRSGIEDAEDMQRNNLTITAPRDLEVADLFRIAPPTMTVLCTISEFHENDSDVVVIWTGRIVDVDFRGLNAVITLEPVYTAMRRNGLRRNYQRQCPHALYGGGCRVNREAFRVDGVAEAITAATVQVTAASGQPDGYFAGGFIEYEVATGIYERRFILDHTGALLKLSNRPVGLENSQNVRVYPGCDHTIDTCASKFNNAVNYGGMPYFTQKNPFSGDPVY